MANRSQFFMLLAGVSAAAVATSAMAQDAAAPAAGEAALDEVVVTGSRIARTTFETPTPVTAISEKQLEAKAASTVVELLRDIPALRPNQIQGGGRSIGVSNFNMRGLGSSRTLVLLDGQRLLDSSPVGGFDVNVIPAPLITRVEIVTAGVSSVYGSDAVTGVVNVILNNKLDGGKADIQYGVSSRGDSETVTASLALGGKFHDGRGRVVFAASYLDRPDILYQGQRGWGDDGVTLVPNAAYTATNGQFRQLIVPNARLSQMTNGGVIVTAGPLQNIQFGPGGQQSLFVRGTNFGTVWMQGGSGLLTQPDFGVLIPSIKQESAFSRVTYDVTPDIEARLDFLGSRTKAVSTNNFNYNNGDITIRQDNVFLPANIRAAMVANNLATIRIGRTNPETGINYNTSRNHYYRAGAGLKGSFLDDWTWELGASYTYSLAENTGEFNRNQANWLLALDAVAGPNGQPVCRSTLTNPNNGCAPANIFGENTISQAAVNYVTGTSFQRSFSRSLDLAANVGGELGATWAGPIKVAAGAEYRRDTVNSKSDPISNINGWRQGTFASYAGQVKVWEGYGETSVPLARDTSFARSIDLDLAGRYVDYSTSGSTAVWKVGLNWAVNTQVRFRGAYSKDFRAPKIDDLFSASSLRAGTTVIDRTTNRTANINTLAGGNRNLDPEVAHTFTAGVVLQPDFLPRLQLSADVFDIDLKDALTVPTAQEVVDRCFGGDQTFCAGITRDAANTITQVQVTAFNSQTLKTRGIDFEASYQFPLDELGSGLSGDVGLRTVVTYVDRLITSTGASSVDTAGQLQGTFATPKFRSSTTVSYANGPLNLRALVNVVGKGKYDNTYGPLDLDKNNYPAFVYLDLSAQYDLTERVQLYAKVENVLDKDPPLIANGTITIAASAGSQFYDLRGRFFGFGARYRW
ncbi:MAG: TonB-dependent receptor [Phenylobacterium sp.]|uniref:TonB-dependent receptor domain-containing protein n=1 Tax=Phenylobacterium sp. TaxID=1871053 RepID=UPI001A4CBC4F|nr:TonB-dependent receptor [Phenylobacterium sp.]MBL8555603.1 TonB-dependent receptor [Phenylobacterium sp.]